MLPNMMYLVPPPVLPGKALKEPWAPQHGPASATLLPPTAAAFRC